MCICLFDISEAEALVLRALEISCIIFERFLRVLQVSLLLIEADIPGVWASTPHDSLQLLLLDGHLFLLHHLLLSHGVSCYHDGHSFDKSKHDASNHGILESGLSALPDGQHVTGQKTRHNGILGLILLSVPEQKTVNGTETSTPHGKGSADEWCSIPHMGKCTHESLTSWSIVGTCMKQTKIRQNSTRRKKSQKEVNLPFMKYHNPPPKHPILKPIPRSSNILPGQGCL